jgi:hypothetical protein
MTLQDVVYFLRIGSNIGVNARTHICSEHMHIARGFESEADGSGICIAHVLQTEAKWPFN